LVFKALHYLQLTVFSDAIFPPEQCFPMLSFHPNLSHQVRQSSPYGMSLSTAQVHLLCLHKLLVMSENFHCSSLSFQVWFLLHPIQILPWAIIPELSCLACILDLHFILE
jgi:hypothetical protein